MRTRATLAAALLALPIIAGAAAATPQSCGKALAGQAKAEAASAGKGGAHNGKAPGSASPLQECAD